MLNNKNHMPVILGCKTKYGIVYLELSACLSMHMRLFYNYL